jgi:hypothetical protein
MFIQVIQGHVADRDELRAAFDRWQRELAPESTGWLGSTAGVAADDTFIALERFESAEAARHNSDRPEQHQWWMETAKLFAGDVAFHDSREVVPVLQGGSDRAGYVQVTQGRTRDRERMVALLNHSAAEMAELHPEIIGGTVALYGEGEFTQAIYFTSHAEARRGEQREEFQERFAAQAAPLMIEIRRYDLIEPWLYSTT